MGRVPSGSRTTCRDAKCQAPLWPGGRADHHQNAFARRPSARGGIPAHGAVDDRDGPDVLGYLAKQRTRADDAAWGWVIAPSHSQEIRDRCPKSFIGIFRVSWALGLFPGFRCGKRAQSWTDRPVLLRLQFGESAGSAVEGLVYIDGRPYQGLDPNHDEVFLPEGAAGRTFEVHIRVWAGLASGRRNARTRVTRADLCWLDEAVDDLCFTARAMHETAEALGEASPVAALIWPALERTLLAVDWSAPGSRPFYASASRARDILSAELAKIPPTKEPVTISVVGHTHIDVAWLWRLAHTREKAARSFATVLRLMERFPEYLFL